MSATFPGESAEYRAALSRTRQLPAPMEAGLLLLLLLLAGAGWAVTVGRMDGMDAGPGTNLGGLDWFIVGWAVMMAAMMVPSLLPAAVRYARIRSGDSDRHRTSSFGATGLFVAGYLAPWVMVGALAYAVIEGARSFNLAFLAWDEAGPYVAGGVIVGAALYEFTAVKRACLRHCRNPRFAPEDLRGGPIGPLRAGLVHGGYCVGCCWALMAALFALGVMSIGWMVLIAALIGIEKLLPGGALASAATAALLVVLGIGVATAPSDVPGLTVPGSPAAERSMEAMGMDQSDTEMSPMEPGMSRSDDDPGPAATKEEMR